MKGRERAILQGLFYKMETEQNLKKVGKLLPYFKKVI
jgi:hypothetical protein